MILRTLLTLLASLFLVAAGPADRFFTDPALTETRALLVMQDGALRYERYGPGFSADTRLISWSMAKSVTAVLAGILVDQGKLSLDKPGVLAEWDRPGDPRRAITLRHLLHMASGLHHVEGAEAAAAADTVRILFTDRANQSAAASIAQPLYQRPGERMRYSTATSVIVAEVITRAVTRETEPAKRRTIMRAWMNKVLFAPAGMTSMLVEFDGAGTFQGGSLMHATARDWARFGQLLLAGGRGIISRQWLAFMRAASPTDGGYGGHIWLNTPRPAGRDAALFPERGPADLYSAIGHLGQYVMVAPSKRLVVVRLGKTPGPKLDAVRDALATLVKQWPAAPSNELANPARAGQPATAAGLAAPK
jgi:CubicO group peptidase (beta-lactamase class C family)